MDGLRVLKMDGYGNESVFDSIVSVDDQGRVIFNISGQRIHFDVRTIVNRITQTVRDFIMYRLSTNGIAINNYPAISFYPGGAVRPMVVNRNALEGSGRGMNFHNLRVSSNFPVTSSTDLHVQEWTDHGLITSSQGFRSGTYTVEAAGNSSTEGYYLLGPSQNSLISSGEPSSGTMFEFDTIDEDADERYDRHIIFESNADTSTVINFWRY